MRRALGITLFLLCAAASAENELFTLTLVTKEGRITARLRDLMARQLPKVELKSSTAIARYRQSPQLIEATCAETAYYLHEAAGALIDRGCLSESDVITAVTALRSAMARNQAYYAPNEKNPLLVLDMALGAAAAGRSSEALSLLDRPEMRGLPAAEQDIARRLRRRLSR